MNAAAVRAASREHERTREWLEKSGIPKAIRVAQRESYGVLRAYGLVEGKKGNLRLKDEVGRSFHYREELSDSTIKPDEVAVSSRSDGAAQKQLSEAQVLDLAEACVALLQTQGKSIEATLQEITRHGKGNNCSSDNERKKGWLSATDTERVRILAAKLVGSQANPSAQQGTATDKIKL